MARSPEKTSSGMEAENIAEAIIAGNRQMLARAITLVESSKEEHQEKAHAVLDLCLAQQSESMVIGITGSPGAGKSSFIEALGEEIIHRGLTLAVLCIDPSSRRSGGSILGDKARMEKLSTRPEAFIRPTPSSCHLGGSGPRTHETIMLTRAAGYDVILVETVGVGQSEVQIENMTDCILLLMLPGSGDELQGIKRGIMEIADIICITKTDGEQERSASLAQADFEAALGMLPPKYEGFHRKVLLTSALNGTGIAESWEEIAAHFSFMRERGILESHRQEQLFRLLEGLVENELKKQFHADPAVVRRKKEIEAAVLSHSLSPFSGASLLVKAFTRRR
ncbi:MAG: methylmalonyl Co-A mutase-associated GTPase MeaB [Chlorobium phaeovibrioides]|nr:methylmalonyl Co-A mutase-associated GTPase MeaB [Chlorobium phaeovibrioides]